MTTKDKVARRKLSLLELATLYNRYNRWSQKGHWQYMFAELTAALAGTPDEISIQKGPDPGTGRGLPVAAAIGLPD